MHTIAYQIRNCLQPSKSADYLLIHGISEQGGLTIVWTQEYNDASCNTGHIIPGASTGTDDYRYPLFVAPINTGYCESCDENDVFIAPIAEDS